MLKKKFWLSCVLIVLVYLVGFLHATKRHQAQNALQEQPPALLFTVWEEIEKRFLEPTAISPEKMWYGAIKGLVWSLEDPYSEFLAPTESEEFLSSLEGTLTGIGAEVGIREEVLTVISPLRGSPAERAGLKPGDQIFKIDAEYSHDFSLFEAVKKIRGPIGTTVKLTILRDQEVEPREISIIRELIDFESVTVDFVTDKIAVLTIASFVDDVISEFKKALVKLQKQDLDGLILDLRFNSGGLLEAAVFVVSAFLAEGEAVLIQQRGQPLNQLRVHGYPALPDLPLAVLLNAGSASASEIVAGALQDTGRAKIFGETSFGKGTVQEIVDGFVDGSLLRITIAKWQTPAGREIEGVGITPDVVVPMDLAEFDPADLAQDQQLQAALTWLQQGE